MKNKNLPFHQIIKKPLITEKTMLLANERKYTFAVDVKATKKQIKEAINYLYQVKVKKINIIKTKGKKKRVGRLRRKEVRSSDWKKAVVQLEANQKIAVFEELAEK